MFYSRTWQWFFLLIAVVCVCGYLGWLPPVEEITGWLAEQPHVKSVFPDSLEGRAEALWFVFEFTLLSPFIALVASVALWFVVLALSGVLEPVVRGLRLPAWTATAVVLFAGSVTAYVERDLWVPGSLYILGVVVRAYKVVIS